PAQGQGVRPVRSGLTRARDVASSKAGKTPRPRAVWEAVVLGGAHRGNGVNAGPPSGGRVRHPPGEEVTGQAAKEAGCPAPTSATTTHPSPPSGERAAPLRPGTVDVTCPSGSTTTDE